MLKNFIKIFILSITLTTILYSSEDLFLKKKIQIEDKFRGQVNLNPDLFKVWIGTRQEANINSKYQITIFSMKGIHWKWRMHGGAITLSQQLNESKIIR